MTPRRCILSLLGIIAAAFAAIPANAREAVLFDGTRVATIIHDTPKPLELAASLLSHDLTALSGQTPHLSTRLSDCTAVCVVIGQYDSKLARTVASEGRVELTSLKGQWERYGRVLVPTVKKPGVSYLLIAGSDMRGAIYGVVDLTREMGVSAWEWWADVTPPHTDHIAVSGDWLISKSPSVQYRGIFLNDEDWALQPWAAKTYEPETGDIGPKTYARIFELMWRLKANTLWPAMHDSTKPFYQIKGNAETARDYAIVMGTSHAEPMMRNNVREWDDRTRGDFNYVTNRAQMVDYWRQRVEQVKDFENIYSIGLRGKHDSAMEGVSTSEQARDVLTDVFRTQRDLLAKAQNKPADEVPQALTLYKEVLDIYKAGLKVPDDVTLVWPDDNYGYISQLPTLQERTRSGGSGVYYHISYWGRPHDYLWLGTTQPALIREEMQRAYQAGARKLWIVNVGDIKPAEYLTQYFLDLAFNGDFDQTPAQKLTGWMGTQFGQAAAPEITAIMTEYYALAFERRPEFMGFGQSEPITPNQPTPYTASGGDEAQRRLDRYAAITRRAEAVYAALPADRKSAFFELVLYPVRASASLNERILKLDLANLRAREGRPDANTLVTQAKQAHQRIIDDTAAYNALENGKWRGMMNMAPRRLPVFDEPAWPQWTFPANGKPVRTNGKAGRIISIAATQSPDGVWEQMPGLGSQGGSLRTRLDFVQSDHVKPLVYRFETAAQSDAWLDVIALPVHPLTPANGLHLGVRVDDQPVQVLDYETFGRSDAWKQNVLTNTAVMSLRLPQLSTGAHRLEIYAVDPGFILDRLDIVPDGAPKYYGAPYVKVTDFLNELR
ncbi:glycosyl hydrolase 115 family protein [Asticcacaulis sp.]|uniref:glycosyl hydrolase 115 family protein n=1 Tax=Asticcacaulis sp. TaxID=1872648 RepID=UPI002C890DE8|nr:glycosyl hydrolase 115 family protein [Asticcacaulis sp.]HTM83273.1 glycosyl hydrolase 115 family protein [Asticcacaulis sp.]